MFSSPNSFTIAENTTLVTTMTSIDDFGTAQRYSLVDDNDKTLFSIDAATGVLSFIAARNFESPLDIGSYNTYNLTIQVEDSTGLKNTLDVSVAITNVNEAPTLVANEIITVECFLGDIGQISILDPDAGDELTLSITGGSAQAFFSVDPTSGTINQQTSLSPGVYTLEVLLSDADGMSTNAVLQIRIVAEPELGTANNTNDNTEKYLESSGVTEESGNMQIAGGSKATVRLGMNAIDEGKNFSETVSPVSTDESNSAVHTNPSAISDKISILFAVSPVETQDTASAPRTSEPVQNTAQSRGYSVVLELLLSKAANAFDEFESVLVGSPYRITLTPYMLDSLPATATDISQQQAQERIELIHQAGKVASITLSVGYWQLAL